MDWKLIVNLVRYAALAGMMMTAYRIARRRHQAEAVAVREPADHQTAVQR